MALASIQWFCVITAAAPAAKASKTLNVVTSLRVDKQNTPAATPMSTKNHRKSALQNLQVCIQNLKGGFNSEVHNSIHAASHSVSPKNTA
jgi:hypothetical protein